MPVFVADSFRVREHEGAAEVRGFELHLERFDWNVTEALSETADPDPDWYESEFEPFLDRVPAEIARAGAGFPRVEFVLEDGLRTLRVAPRPLPPLTTSLKLRHAPGVDLRWPWIKGPNIERLARLNASLAAEALMSDIHGSVSEGATTAILWWDADTLCTPETSERVASVTEQLVLAAAVQSGFEVSERSIRPAELAQHEVWALNALHGIRTVSHLDGVPLPPPVVERLQDFRRHLDQTWRPVTASAR